MDTEDRPQVREALLAAAREELVEHGGASISLRAVARRAGVSHAAPKYHFRDRAGLLTAVATEGFQLFAAALSSVTESQPQQRLAALGRTYIDFGLDHPALFELMFRPTDLHTDDAALQQAQRAAIGALSDAVTSITADPEPTPSGVPTLALLAWGLAHGLVVLARDGALQAAAGLSSDDSVALPHHLIEQFAAAVR